jgi:hypothetical protein
MGRKKRDGNHSPPKNNLMQDSEGKEENGYPVPDCNKTKINVVKNQIMPTEHPQRRNTASKHREFNGDVTRHG